MGKHTTFTLVLIFAVCFAPKCVHANKTCRGLCHGAVKATVCRAGCAVTKGLCKTQDALCIAGCAFWLFKGPRRRCERKCRRHTVEPCIRKIVNNCRRKCANLIVRPCERGCKGALPKVCRAIMRKVSHDKLVEASATTGGCFGAAVAVGATATKVGLKTGLSVTAGNPVGGFAGSVLGVVIGNSFGKTCRAISGRGYSSSLFIDQACRKMGF